MSLFENNQNQKIVVPENEVELQTPLVQAGPITKSDVLLAQAIGAHVVGFNADITPDAQSLASSFSLHLSTFDVIYNMADFLCVFNFFID